MLLYTNNTFIGILMNSEKRVLLVVFCNYKCNGVMMRILYGFFSIGIWCCVLLWSTNIVGQFWGGNEGIVLEVETKGKLVAPNRLIMMIELTIPEHWKLNVHSGYGAIIRGDIDTMDLSLTFRENSKCRLVERLKASRKPSLLGFYTQKVVFAQTIFIDTKQLPIYIDAELKWALLRRDEQASSRGCTCCLLKVAQSTTDVKTVRAGWNCKERSTIYLDDLLD